MGISQKDLARLLNLTFQQIQKYESAGNRISASNLYRIAQVLQVPIGVLFNETLHNASNEKEIHNLVMNISKLSSNDREMLAQFIARLAQ